MTWNELQAAIYREYETNYEVLEYDIVFKVPGGGAYSNMELEVTGFTLNHRDHKLELMS